MILLQLLIQLLILMAILILGLMKLMLLTLLRLLVAHPQALILMLEEPSALSSNAPEDVDVHFRISSIRLQCERGRPSYGPVVQDPAWRPYTHRTRWCSRR